MEPWVVTGYVVTYGTIAAYLLWLVSRLRALEKGGR